MVTVLELLLSKEALGSAATLLAMVSYVPYIWLTLKGKVKPHAFSWTIWGLLTLIGFAAQWVEGAGPGSWVMGFSGVVCSFIAVLGFIMGEKNVTM